MKILKGPFSDEPAGEVGWSAVMAKGSGAFAEAGEPLGILEWLFGKRRFYQVFTGPHRLEFRFDLQSFQSTYKFVAQVTATAQVIDAVQAARNGLRDTAEALRQPIEEALQEAVRSVDFRQTGTACADGLAAIKAVDHSLIRLSQIVLKIEPDADAREHLRTIEGRELRTGAWEAEAETKKPEREQILDSFETLDKMLVQMMTTDDPQKRAMLEKAIALRMQRDDELTQLQIQTFKVAVESGRYEEHEIPKGLIALLEKMDKTYGGGSLPQALLGGAASAEGEKPPRPEGDKADEA